MASSWMWDRILVYFWRRVKFRAGRVGLGFWGSKSLVRLFFSGGGGTHARMVSWCLRLVGLLTLAATTVLCPQHLLSPDTSSEVNRMAWMVAAPRLLLV
jgi:hypothetical protein